MGDDGGLGVAARKEEDATHRQACDRDDEAGRGVHRGAQDRGEHGAHDVDELVDRGLEGVGGRQLSGLVQDRRPARAHERAGCAPRGTREGRRDEKRPRRGMHEDGGDQRGHRQDRDRPRGAHDAQLPVAVDAAREDGRAQSHDDDVDRRDGAGQRVVTVLGAHHQDRRQAHHRHWHTQHKAGRGELPRLTDTQNIEIGTEHPLILPVVGGRKSRAEWGVRNHPGPARGRKNLVLR